MTIDFIKIKVENQRLKSSLWSNPLLYFHSEREMLLFDNETIHTKNTRQYNGIVFENTQHSLYIYFKPHYYFNNNLHNANDFKVKDCINTLLEFIITFKLDPKELFIINIEFSLNIVLPKNLICVKDFLTVLTYHNNKQFYTSDKYQYCKYSTTKTRSGKSNAYKIIKCYAKGLQFPQFADSNTFRFEVKSNRKKYIQSLGIYTLNDLLMYDIYGTLGDNLLNEFDNILIIDENTIPTLSETKLKNHIKKNNPLFWQKLLNKSRNVFKNNFNAYYKALDTCDTHLKKEVRNLIIDKLVKLKSVHI